MIDEQLIELRQIFLGEGMQNLEEIERHLMELEMGFEPQRLQTLMRLAHNIKGSARSIGFLSLASMAHIMEDAFTAIRDRGEQPQSALISAMLFATDVLRKSLQAIDIVEGEAGESAEFADARLRLQELMPTKGGVSNKPAETSAFGFFDDEPATPPSAPPSGDIISAPSAANKVSAAGSASKETRAAASVEIRVAVQKLAELTDLLGELVVHQAILEEKMRQQSDDELKSLVSYISKVVLDVQGRALSFQMVPVKPLFLRLRRAVRDAATELKRQVNFIEEGADLEIDRTILETVSDALVHMVRNSVDHGIEPEADRIAKGKPAQGTITLSFEVHETEIGITIKDDGKGLDRDVILRKAISKGLVKPGLNLSDAEVFRLIFHSGFSTKDTVTSVSGRGVGMEVVERVVQQLKGTIQIHSVPGEGTQFGLKLPLSLSIIGGMVVRCNRSLYVVPLSQLQETIEARKFAVVGQHQGQITLDVRGEQLPVYGLEKLLFGQNSDFIESRRPILVTEYEGYRVGVAVDEIINQQQVVLKQLGAEWKEIAGIMAGAVLSNGDPGLIVDLQQLVAGEASHAAA